MSSSGRKSTASSGPTRPPPCRRCGRTFETETKPPSTKGGTTNLTTQTPVQASQQSGVSNVSISSRVPTLSQRVASLEAKGAEDNLTTSSQVGEPLPEANNFREE